MRPRLQALLAALIGIGIGLLFLQEPGFGDDLTYWSFAFDLHERGLIAWQKGSFHDLRWPVWGVSWLLQWLLGPGLISYYGVPLLYLGFGSALAFTFARLVSGSNVIGWAAATAFAFHPLLDSICFRPMPDLSEGVWGAAVVLSWYGLMQTRTAGTSVGLAAMLGATVFIIEANRITGVFIIPVIALATLLWFRGRFGWLVLAGVFCLVLYAGECGFYAWRFDNWHHDITANMGNAENKGTEPISVWYLPFRFFDTLWKGNPLAPVYCLSAVLGLWTAWRRCGIPGRIVVLWFVVMFLEYSCAPQPVWPIRPLIRDADRFLAGLAVPFAVLSAIGLGELIRLVVARWPVAGVLTQRPALTGIIAIAATALITSRSFTSFGFVPEMRAYMHSLPDGATVFTHKAMREFAYLISGADAQRFSWLAPNHIMQRTDALEAQAARAEHFWYARKLVWLTTRKRLEKKALPEQAPLGTYLDEPERQWRLMRMFAKGDNPDLIFYRRRTPADPAPVELDHRSPEFSSLLPTLPAEWNKGEGSTVARTVTIPTALRGKLMRVELHAASSQVEALNIRLRIHAGKRASAEYLLKPYLYPSTGKEFFILPIPADADRAEIQLKFSSKARKVTFTAVRLILEDPPRS